MGPAESSALNEGGAARSRNRLLDLLFGQSYDVEDREVEMTSRRKSTICSAFIDAACVSDSQNLLLPPTDEDRFLRAEPGCKMTSQQLVRLRALHGELGRKSP